MSYSKLIHEYLDRQLDGANEDVLFSELARNPELRIEFNQQVQIQSVALSDMAMISPPAEATNSIFSALSFSIPSSEFFNRIKTNPNEEANISTGSAFVNAFKKHLTTIMAVLITAGLTTAVFVFTGDYFANNKSTVIVQRQAVPSVGSFDNTNLAANNIGNVNQTTNHTIAPVSHRNGNNDFVSNQSAIGNANTDNSTRNALSMSSSVNSIQPKLNAIRESQNVNFSSIPIVQYEPFMTDFIPKRNFNDGKLAIIAGFSNSSSSVKVNFPTRKFYQNFNLSALYKLGDNWYIGVQLGQEELPQNFTRNLLDEGLNYQQNYAFLYYGGLIKYSHTLDILGDYSKYASIYGQIFTGSTKYGGVLLRPQLGLSFSPYGMWTFNIGYEWINYNYFVDKNWNSTDKAGLTIGTGISF